jgi:competence protein ComGC
VEIEQTVNKRKKITRLLLILLMILLSLGCIKYLISKSKKYISENGKSSMGAVVEQIQQTYDLQVSGYYSQLQLVEEFLLHERKLSLETDVNKSFFEAWEKESESTLIFIQENGQAISARGTKMRIDMPSKLLLDLKNGYNIGKLVRLDYDQKKKDGYLVAIPSPVPCILFVRELSARVNASKIVSLKSADIPIPLSLTKKRYFA